MSDLRRVFVEFEVRNLWSIISGFNRVLSVVSSYIFELYLYKLLRPKNSKMFFHEVCLLKSPKDKNILHMEHNPMWKEWTNTNVILCKKNITKHLIIPFSIVLWYVMDNKKATYVCLQCWLTYWSGSKDRPLRQVRSILIKYIFFIKKVSLMVWHQTKTKKGYIQNRYYLQWIF